MNFSRWNLRIFDSVRIQNIIAHPVQGQTDQYYMYAEDRNGELVVAESAEQRCREGQRSNQKKKEGIDVRKSSIHVLGIDRNEKMMRAPVSEKKGKGEDVAYQARG